MRRAVAPFVAATLAVVASAGDDGAPPPAPVPPPKPWTSPDKKFTFSMPADWSVKPRKADETEFALTAQLPGDMGEAYVALVLLHGAFDARGLPAGWAADTDTRTEGGYKIVEGPRTGVDPVPWGWIRVAKDGVATDEWVGFRVVRRNVLVLRFDFDKAAWPKIESACAAATLSLTTTLPLWPEPPVGYRPVTRGGFVFHVHPDVPDAEIDGVQKRLREAEAAFVKWHGPVEWSADAPFVVAVNPTLLAATRCSPSIDGHTLSGNCADLKFDRLSVVLAAKGEPFAAPEFAREAWRSLLDQAGFDGYPRWLELGESQAASAEATIGKPLPAVPDGYLVQIPKPLPRLDELAKLENPGFDVSYAMLGYVAFFRLGPKPWRDAFAAFQKEGASSHDWDAAEKKHLLSLDQAKLRDAAQGWLARNLTSVKPK